MLRALAQRWLAALALLLVLPGVPELLRALSGVEAPCCPLEDCGEAHDGIGVDAPAQDASSAAARTRARLTHHDPNERDGADGSAPAPREEHDDEGCTHLRSHCTCCPQAGALARAALELAPSPRTPATFALSSTLLRAEGFGTPPLRPPA